MNNSSAQWVRYFTMNAWFLGLGFMWNSLHRFILPAILPILVGVSIQATALSALTTAGLVIAIIVQPIAGAISDRSLSRFGRRRPMMVTFSLLCVLLLAGIALAPDFALLFVLYCLLQASSNMAHGPAQGLIPDLVPARHHGAASGVKTFIDNLTLVMAGLLVGQVLLSIRPDLYESARIAIAVIAVALILFLVITVAFTRERPITPEERPAESLRTSVVRAFSVVGNIAEVWNNSRSYAWLLAARLMFLAGIQVIANFGQFYFKDVVLAGDPNAAQRAPQLMGQLLTIVALMLVAVAVPAGVLSDRFGRRAVSAGGALISIIGALGLLFVRSIPLANLGGIAITDMTLVATFIGVGAGAYLAVNWAWATDLIWHERAAQYLGISNLATAGAGIVANLGGPMIDLGNAQSPGLGYNIVFAVGAVWVFISVLFLPLIREGGKSGGRESAPRTA